MLLIRYRFWVFDEDLGASHLVLVDVDVDGDEHVFNALPWFTLPARPRLGRQDGVPTTHSHTVSHTDMMYACCVSNQVSE